MNNDIQLFTHYKARAYYNICQSGRNQSSIFIAYSSVLPIYIFGIIINVVLVYVIYTNRKFHTPSYILSANASISDIMLAISSLLLGIFSVIRNSSSGLDNSSFFIICKCTTFGYVSSYTISALSFMTISIDRYLTLRDQTNSNSPFVRPTVLKLTMIMIWIVGICLSIPIIFITKKVTCQDSVCSLQLFRHIEPTLLTLHILNIVITYPVPLVTVSILYYNVIKKMKSLPIPLNENANSNFNHRHVHATKMMIIASILFMINTSVLYILSVFQGFMDSNLVTIFRNQALAVPILIFTALLTACEVMQNPILFYSYNKTFRKAVHSIKPSSTVS